MPDRVPLTHPVGVVQPSHEFIVLLAVCGGNNQQQCAQREHGRARHAETVECSIGFVVLARISNLLCVVIRIAVDDGRPC